MITNKELQDTLKEYPDDLPVGMGIQFNDNISVFYDVKTDGIQSGNLKVIMIHCPDVDMEYETLMNGSEII